MAHKSFRYKAKTTWTSERLGVLSDATDIIVGSPPEFKASRIIGHPKSYLLARSTPAYF